jgi:hypothetical protein
MSQFAFLPMSVREDSVLVYEPFGSMISKQYSCDKLSGSAKYICLCLKNIQDKKTFLQNIASSIKDAQRDMINNAMRSKAIYSL